MSITRSAPWQRLDAHAGRLRETHLRELFAAEPDRAQRLSLRIEGLLADFSKQRVDAAVLDDLLSLADAANLARWRDELFSGAPINTSENRPALHVALRHGTACPAATSSFPRADFDVLPEVIATRARMAEIANALRDGKRLGVTGQAIRAIVNLGIGGSDLGPRMAVEALKSCAHPVLAVHFVSNLDGADLAPLLQTLDPRTTLFIVASKTFTTQETLTNARTARQWMLSQLAADGAEQNREAAVIKAHFLAVTTARNEAMAFGIPPENMLPMWDWVGGRYSLWSAIGMPLMIAIGPAGFEALLAGAETMDQHFLTAPLAANLPVLMALLGIWNTDFLGAETSAVLPYNGSLQHLPAYLQQLEMESNGKSICRDGKPLDCKPTPIVWGAIGINGQHAFFQLLHQGGWLVPCDFIACAQSDYPLPGHHDLLLANCFAQSAALAFGRTEAEAREQLGSTTANLEALLPHRVFPGNQPSSTLLLSKLDPRNLGMLLALYEHKVFVQGVIWGINSFDQWGVELGKTVATGILPAFRGDESTRASLDPSTRQLIDFCRVTP